jgi:uncharacterized membrane protein YgcG
MSQPRSFNRRLLPFVAALALMVAGLVSASAQAQSYGEIGKPFVSTGKFRLSKFDRAFGVDPSTDDVYVGDEPKENEYRIQRFDSTGTLLNSVSMKIKGEATEGIEGIAIDPALKRVYALIVYEREGKEGSNKFVDPEIYSAGTLLAFTPELTAAAGTTTENGVPGVLANKETLHAQSETTASPSTSALLEPSGIAVDPTTHDVIVLGQEEQCTKGGGECEERLLSAAQRVSSSGTLGKRWVDSGECFDGEGEGSEASCDVEDEQVFQPGSPVGVIATGNGRVLVDVPSSQIWEIPQSFESGLAPADAPRPVTVESGGVAELSNPLQELFRFPGAVSPEGGGSIAYVQEQGEAASEGRVYQAMEVEGVATEFDDPGVLMLKLSSAGALSEVGWTGGQNKIKQEQLAGGGCAISAFSAPLVAAGSKRTAFVLDPNKLPKQQELPTPQVTTFGPGGSHCPTASATAPIASLNGTQDGTAGNPAPVGQKVTLSSNVTQANALSVTWNFGDGSSETVNKPQFRTTKVQHAFATTGTKTVTETIATDNLAEPSIKAEAQIVVGAASGGGGGGGGDGGGGGGGGDGGGSEGGSSNPPATTTSTTTATTTSPGGVLGTTAAKGNPAAKLAGNSLSVTSSGGLAVKVSCPTGETACAGTITLKTLSAVGASKGKKSILTLASGSFSVAGGATKSVTLHLSAKARTLLAHSHVLRASATLLAHDSTGATHTTVATVTLKPAKKAAHH